MTNPPEIQAFEPWGDSALEADMEVDMDDDELLFDADADDELDAKDEQIDSTRGIASWRRIEMAKEDKFLKSALADFDDYPDYDDADDDLAVGYTQ